MQPSNLEHLYLEHRKFLYDFALRRVRDPALAEDLLQDTMLAGATGWSSFEGKASERTWLMGILKHKIADQFRLRDRKCFLLDDGRAAVGDMSYAGGDLASIAEGREFLRALHKSLLALPRRMARAFVLREIEGFTTQEICTMLGISPGNLWVIMSRARGRLRDRLIEHQTTPGVVRGTVGGQVMH